MTEKKMINDMSIKPLAWREGVLSFVQESDPLLRRFGQIDYLRLATGETFEIHRQQADEVWTVTAGVVKITLQDQREDSPSFEAEQTLELNGDSPQAVLAPFGVRCRITGLADAQLLRLTTHQDGTDPEDQTP